MGAARELQVLYTHIGMPRVNSRLTSSVLIKAFNGVLLLNMLCTWWALVLGGLWEKAVKSLKCHFQHITGDISLILKDLAMILHQVEACLNSRPLIHLPQPEDGMELLTPAHFLIG